MESGNKLSQLTYDMSAIPDGFDLQNVFEMFKKTGIVIYDSMKGRAPEIISNEKFPKRKLEIKDINAK